MTPSRSVGPYQVLVTNQLRIPNWVRMHTGSGVPAWVRIPNRVWVPHQRPGCPTGCVPERNLAHMGPWVHMVPNGRILHFDNGPIGSNKSLYLQNVYVVRGYTITLARIGTWAGHGS